MEILFVSHKYPPATGGMEKQSLELIDGVAKHCKVHRLVYRKGEDNLLLFFLQLNRNILHLLKENPGIQLIHFNDGLIAALALFHKGYAHIKRVVTLHGLDVVFPLPYFQRYILPKFNRYDQLITVSRATAEAAILRGIAPEKITVVKNGVDHGMATPSPSTLAELSLLYPVLLKHKSYMLTLGRPVKRKGFSWFLREVVPTLPPDFHLLMVGPFEARKSLTERLLGLLPQKLYHLLTLFLGYPSDQGEIRKLLKQGHLQDRVTHLGKVPFAHLHTLLAHASAFLMPNIKVSGDMEGFGLVCLEASLSGTLVLASDCEGITDAILPFKNGLLLPAGNALAWKEQLVKVLEDPTFFKQRALEFRDYSRQHYGWEKMALDYVQVFQDIVQEEINVRQVG
ncbi:glycosyltransferase family 4 protein [Sphingobacterium lactis]|uniref:glycosyltransferase family 4 protein n=1 Tax=Sphingobacterium lactis TaxID=797291 RepID=UPI003EC5B20F